MYTERLCKPYLSWRSVAPALTSAMPSMMRMVRRVSPVFNAPSNPEKSEGRMR